MRPSCAHHVPIMCPSYARHVPVVVLVMYQSCAGHVPAICQSCSNPVPVMWQSCAKHVLACAFYVPSMWRHVLTVCFMCLSCSRHAPVMWLASTRHVPVIVSVICQSCAFNIRFHVLSCTRRVCVCLYPRFFFLTGVGSEQADAAI